MRSGLTCQRHKRSNPPVARAGDPPPAGPAEQWRWECGIQRATLTYSGATQFVEGLGAGTGWNRRYGAGVARAMRISGFRNSMESVRRKLRGLSAVAGDPGATEHERANAAALKRRLEQRLKDAGTPAGDWSDNAFRLGKWAKNLTKSASPAPTKGDWTDDAFRLGRALRRGYRRWSSD